MHLLSEDKLVWSPIVANSRMNRERKASGINSYEKEFNFKPEIYLQAKIKQFGYSSWLDLCCGEGKALVQTAEYFYHHALVNDITLKGIDLLDSFYATDEKSNFIQFESKSVVNYIPDKKYDLITCSHGIHYLGDKLNVLETAMNALSSHGMFIANLDLSNIIIQGNNPNLFLKTFFKENQIDYNNKSKNLKRIGTTNIKFGLLYLGADDTFGPNYTGQDSVTSHYRKE